MTLSNAIKTRIQNLCKDKNMNLNQLAIASGLNPATIRNIFKSRCITPTLTTIYYICIGFNMSIEEFFSDELFNPENIDD